MEELGSDVTIEMMKNLPGKDILKVCQTSRKLNRICSGERYNRLWQMKLREELNLEYSGENAYDKYVESSKLYMRHFYLVIFIDEDDHEAYPTLFENEESAIEYVIDELLDRGFNVNYFVVRSQLKDEGSYELDKRTRFDLHKIKIKKQKSDYSKQRELYDNLQTRIREEFPNQISKVYRLIKLELFELYKRGRKFKRTSLEIEGIPQNKLNSFFERELEYIKQFDILKPKKAKRFQETSEEEYEDEKNESEEE